MVDAISAVVGAALVLPAVVVIFGAVSGDVKPTVVSAGASMILQKVVGRLVLMLVLVGIVVERVVGVI